MGRIATTHTTDTARGLRDAVRRLVVAQGVLAEARRPCGATVATPHAYALLELLHRDAPMTVSELASKLAIDRTNVSRLCARMERDGELSRGPDPADGRAKALRLTPRGEVLARSVDDSSARHFTSLASRLGDSVSEVTTALDRLSQAMAPTEENL